MKNRRANRRKIIESHPLRRCSRPRWSLDPPAKGERIERSRKISGANRVEKDVKLLRRPEFRMEGSGSAIAPRKDLGLRTAGERFFHQRLNLWRQSVKFIEAQRMGERELGILVDQLPHQRSTSLGECDSTRNQASLLVLISISELVQPSGERRERIDRSRILRILRYQRGPIFLTICGGGQRRLPRAVVSRPGSMSNSLLASIFAAAAAVISAIGIGAFYQPDADSNQDRKSAEAGQEKFGSGFRSRHTMETRQSMAKSLRIKVFPLPNHQRCSIGRHQRTPLKQPSLAIYT